jgi:peptidyl-tRNA hydrolase, PTH1 family
MKLICGLGNPGRTYERTRHNLGFCVVDALAQRAHISLNSEKFEARMGQGSLGSEKVLLLKPQTFMNLSGRSVAGAARFFKLAAEETLVVHDELDLPFGRIQLKKGGGAGGHNGLKSILESWGEEAFARLRIGIGKPLGDKEKVVGHVLSSFQDEEAGELDSIIEKAADIAQCWTTDGLATAMNRYNRKFLKPR